MQTLTIRTDRRTQLVDVTEEVRAAVSKAQVAAGVCYLYVPHTTAAVLINECADPDVASDIEGALDRMAAPGAVPAQRGKLRFTPEVRDDRREPNGVGGKWEAGPGALARNFLL